MNGAEILMQAGVWIFSLLALASLVSVLVRRPWTSLIARRDNPPEVTSSKLFLETNMVISAVWALLFTVAALLAAVVQTKYDSINSNCRLLLYGITTRHTKAHSLQAPPFMHNTYTIY